MTKKVKIKVMLFDEYEVLENKIPEFKDKLPEFVRLLNHKDRKRKGLISYSNKEEYFEIRGTSETADAFAYGYGLNGIAPSKDAKPLISWCEEETILENEDKQEKNDVK